MANGQNQTSETKTYEVPKFAMTMGRRSGEFNLLFPPGEDPDGTYHRRYRDIGKLKIVDKKSTKSGIRQVYKFTNKNGEESFFVASGSFKDDEDKKRVENLIDENAASYIIGDKNTRGIQHKLNLIQGSKSGHISVQPAEENRFANNPEYKEELAGKYWSRAKQMKAYPVPTHGKPKTSIGDFFKKALIGEEVRDVYGQPQHTRSALNILKEIPKALDVKNIFGFGSPNLPGQEARSGFTWDNPGIVEDARQRQELFNKLEDYKNRDNLSTSPTTGKTMADYLGQDYRESLVKNWRDESQPEQPKKDRRNMLLASLFLYAGMSGKLPGFGRKDSMLDAMKRVHK